jgi:glyoxylate/hydroxypyruvate reductase
MQTVDAPPETLLLIAGTDTAAYRERFEHAGPQLRIVDPDSPCRPEEVDYVAAWRAPPGLFATLPRLRAVFALGAGVDALLIRTDIAPDVPLVRLLDAGMAEQMVEYALLGALTWQRRMHEYDLQQSRRLWRQQPPRMRAETQLGVLGLGSLGGAVATALARFGYPVSGWSRTARSLDGVRCMQGDAGLQALLSGSDVLINMLPSTPQTRGLLTRERLALLRPGAYVVNASRGDQLDLDALCALLDSGQLGGALLDVFPLEPLPTDHPLWVHPRVRITPHVAACTLVEPAVAQIVANIERLRRALPMKGVVDREHAY